jgi:hypothetical protein
VTIDATTRTPHLRAMLRALLIAAALLSAAPAQAGTYNDPFAFGMTREQVEHAAQAPLIYLSGPRGSERYLIHRLSTVPGFYPVDASIVLQFRRGRLTGWRRDWQMRPYWF